GRTERNGVDIGIRRRRSECGGGLPALLSWELVPMARLRRRLLPPPAAPRRGDPWAGGAGRDRLGRVPGERRTRPGRRSADARGRRRVARLDAALLDRLR